MKQTMPISALLAVGLAVLQGCNASAATERSADSSALLVSSSEQGALACTGNKSVTLPGLNYNRFNTVLNIGNDNDQETISIDRVLVYSPTGESLCPELPGPIVLGPHQQWQVNVRSYPPFDSCIPEQGVAGGYFRLVAHWSRRWVEPARGTAWHNPPRGHSQIVISKADTGELITRVPFECSSLLVVP